MHLSYIKKIAPLLAIASCCQFASADNTFLEVWPGDECVDLVTGSDLIVIGEVCTEVIGNNVVVTFNITAGEDEEVECCIKETHICNMPPMIAFPEEQGCLKTKVVTFDIMDVFGFMCWEECDLFQFNGHATVICDRPLRGDNDHVVEPGDPLPDGAGQGNYGDQEYCYGAMYDIGLVCGPNIKDCKEPPCEFTCEDPAPLCGESSGASGDVSCYCSQNAGGEDFCWSDIGCFVPIFYLSTTPGVPCQSDAVCKAGTSCIPSTCCGESYCLPACKPIFGDKGLDDFAEQYGIPPEEMQRALDCPIDRCTLPSGDKKVFEYPAL